MSNIEDDAACWRAFREGLDSGLFFAQINANDLFAHACADAEDIESAAELDAVIAIFKLDGWPGLVEWMERKRGMKSIQSVKEGDL